MELKQQIEKSIQGYKNNNFKESSTHLLKTLSYSSKKHFDLPDTANKTFLRQFDPHNKLDQDKALFNHWQSIYFLFQLTADELSNSDDMFTVNKYKPEEYQSYLFLALELKEEFYSRGKLAKITREINKIFPMPVMVLFKTGSNITLSIIHRRPNKREQQKDVLAKVTLIKDISIKRPHRAHIEILFDLSLEQLRSKYKFTNFLELHNAWQKTLDSSELNKQFFKELSNWYFWAHTQVQYPDDLEKDDKKRNSINLIRLITRLIFVWFLKEKHLMADMLFDEKSLDQVLNRKDQTGSTYYKAILQNLFFATLNLEMNKDKPDSRKFVERSGGYHSQQHLVPAYRYERFFHKPSDALQLFENIPFLNGGLFENLDYEITDKQNKRQIIRIDCFSDNPKNEEMLKVPDELFFGSDRVVDLSDDYGDKKRKREHVRGIIHTLNRYKFTIEENTPLDQEVALDPELLGKVFENLLASYNPETHTTARKQTGSFYTPREIVNYMVDESLIASLKQKLIDDIENRPQLNTKTQPVQKDAFGREAAPQMSLAPEKVELTDAQKDAFENKLRDLISYNANGHLFEAHEVGVLIKAINGLKILDPAVGSGAFPMGILHKLVHVLGKLDPDNARWKEEQIAKVQKAIKEVEGVPDSERREEIIAGLEKQISEIEDAFENNELDYGRKLYLIENCIYGVDIQPIAVQIAKLRFFISLVIDQKDMREKKNRNIRPLPNLETKFVAANTLIGLHKPQQLLIRDLKLVELEKDLQKIRQKHFSARTRREKLRYRGKDKKLRNEIATMLTKDGWDNKSAKQVADWDPYDQNNSAGYFDAEWMLGIEKGFDVVIGNPPYFGINTIDSSFKSHLAKSYKAIHTGYNDIVYYFIFLGVQLLKSKGCSVLITSNYFLGNEYAKKLRIFMGKHLNKIVNFKENLVFSTANIHTCISILDKLPLSENAFFLEANATNNYLHIDKEENKCVNINRNDLNETWLIATSIENKIINKLKIASEMLGNISFIEKGSTSGNNRIFTISQDYAMLEGFEMPLLKKNIKNGDIGKYTIHDTATFLIYIDNETKINSFPKIYAYLKSNKSKLAERNEVKQGLYHWSRLERPRKKSIFDSNEKIIVPYRAEKNRFAYDDQQRFNDGGDIRAIVINNSNYKTKYVLAVLNSILMDWYYSFIGKPKGKTREYFNTPLSKIPIKIVDNIKQQIITNLVDRVIIAKQNESSILFTTFYELLLDASILEIYFEGEIKKANLDILKHLTNLKPIADDMSDEQKMQVITKTYKELSNPNHPVAQNIKGMDEIEEVRIIKGLDKQEKQNT
ncbi:MAG: hypothetical protein DWQ05_02930 [Calditrichaeota bacterium]|nr:MAG: hypothetical protein DWQ05_02930 [Calditrichota bacterium]